MNIQRLNFQLTNNPKKVILQFFDIGDKKRLERITGCIKSMSDDQVKAKLNDVLSEFEHRHKHYKTDLLCNYEKVKHCFNDNITEERKLLAGAYFSKEYSIEAAALFNPSIVPHPDQSNLAEGAMRFVLSLRATGEGHISSIEFRSGVITKDNEIIPDEVSNFSLLPEKYTIDEELNHNIRNSYYNNRQDANYSIEFSKDSQLSERVIFPFSKSELVGMEDARFVKFTDDNGQNKYYGTYTAYDGKEYRVQLIETEDFRSFRLRTLEGADVKDKGMALFPEKVNGKYVMISRCDAESIFILYSDSIYNWENAEKLLVPEKEWEYIQLGNCGSPIKTKSGWLLITHAVGPMRKYVMSAVLLDLHNPSKVIARLGKPLLEPADNERDGYVPNVVYSCGSLVHGADLIIPYAMNDSCCAFAKTNINDLISFFNNEDNK